MNDAATPATYRPRFASRTVEAILLCCWLVVPGSPVWAEILYDREGIQLRGTARIVSHNAATCNVLEEKYSPEDYERLKANQGQPLQVWQLDISAHNNTGKPLDFLSAHFNIESPWPPCTNWSGDGPGGGPAGEFTDAEGRPKPLEWSHTLKVLSIPYGMRVGQVERDTVFLVVFHEDRPVFKNWSVDFRFGRSGSGGQKGADAGESREKPAGNPPRQRIEFPPEILVDKYLRQAEHLVREKDFPGAREAVEKLMALQREHGLEPAPEDHFRYAQVWAASGSPEQAIEAAVRYLQIRGREAEHYYEAIELINRAEARQTRVEAGETAPETPIKIDRSLTCEGKPSGTECWRALDDPPDCHLWEEGYFADDSLTWTGECSGGLAHGEGTLTVDRVEEGVKRTWEQTGNLNTGKKHGHWVSRTADGTSVQEGSYVNGKKHGRWVWDTTTGSGFEGSYVNGKMHGHWMWRSNDGRVFEGPMVNGNRHGQWVYRRPDGSVVGKMTFVNGEQSE